jgi:hypothetical protein
VNSTFLESCADLQKAGAQILDPRVLFASAEWGEFTVESDGKALYYDSHHLSRSGALYLAPLFERVVPVSQRLEKIDSIGLNGIGND